VPGSAPGLAKSTEHVMEMFGSAVEFESTPFWLTGDLVQSATLRRSRETAENFSRAGTSKESPPQPEPGGPRRGRPSYRLIRYVRSPPSGLKDSTV
jgi:hypothetical protein